jgi:hypothetical protein
MHLPGGVGVQPPAVSPQPFVRVAAQQADATDAPAVTIAHSIVYAASPADDGVLEASGVSEESSPIGTVGVEARTEPVALAELIPAGDTPSAALNAVHRVDAPLPPAPAPPKAETPDKPLPTVAPPPDNEAPLQASAAPTVKGPAPPASYRIEPISVSPRTASEEEELVRRLLDEYTGAFERLDVRATKALYPSVDGKALQRAFEQIESQRVTFEDCGITISGSTANARCRGSATYQPRIGTRRVQIALREWTFDLSKQDTSWRIVNTYVR